VSKQSSLYERSKDIEWVAPMHRADDMSLLDVPKVFVSSTQEPDVQLTQDRIIEMLEMLERLEMQQNSHRIETKPALPPSTFHLPPDY